MYKISRKENESPLAVKQFSSETSQKISKDDLDQIINELMNEYITY